MKLLWDNAFRLDLRPEEEVATIMVWARGVGATEEEIAEASSLPLEEVRRLLRKWSP